MWIAAHQDAQEIEQDESVRDGEEHEDHIHVEASIGAAAIAPTRRTARRRT
jgi:hypothetical protein